MTYHSRTNSLVEVDSDDPMSAIVDWTIHQAPRKLNFVKSHMGDSRRRPYAMQCGNMWQAVLGARNTHTQNVVLAGCLAVVRCCAARPRREAAPPLTGLRKGLLYRSEGFRACECLEENAEPEVPPKPNVLARVLVYCLCNPLDIRFPAPGLTGRDLGSNAGETG